MVGPRHRPACRNAGPSQARPRRARGAEQRGSAVLRRPLLHVSPTAMRSGPGRRRSARGRAASVPPTQNSRGEGRKRWLCSAPKWDFVRDLVRLRAYCAPPAVKTKVLTTEAQPPSCLCILGADPIQVLEREGCHKLLGCRLSTATSDAVTADLDFHLQNASEAFWKHKWVLCDKNVSLAHRLEYFQSVASPVACFASGHRAVHTQHLHKMDVEFRRLLRHLVGPPGGVDWSLPWHEI